MIRFSIFFLMAALAVSGCKKGPSVVVKDPGPAQVPAGTRIAESSDKTVSIMVAAGWKRGGPNSMVAPSLGDMVGGMGEGMSSDIQGMAQNMEREEEELDAAETAELEKNGILIWVNDSSRPIPGEERTSYRVKRTEAGHSTLEEAAQDAKQNLFNAETIEYVDLPIGRAARLESKLTKIDGGELHQIVYIVLNGPHTYNIRFATQNAPESIKQYEKDIMQTLRIKPAPK